MIKNNPNSESITIPLMIIAGLFFIFGFVIWINGALIPLMTTFHELTRSQSYMVASTPYISFVIMALPSSWILGRIGYRKGMSLGLFIMALGALFFIPAALAGTYGVFLSGIFIQSAGMTLLQTAANPYITMLGPIESGAKRIAIMGMANKTAGALASLIFGTLLLSGIDPMKEQLQTAAEAERTVLLNSMDDSVFILYLVMAFVLFLLSLLIREAPLPHVEPEADKQIFDDENPKVSIFQFPHLWFGILTLFVSVGAEVIAGDSIIAYGNALGLSPEKAGFFTTMTFMAVLITYAFGVVLIPKYIRQRTALTFSAVLGIIFTLCILFTTGFTSVVFAAALGIANALVWPAVWPLSLQGLGRFTKTASALLIMAISGGAIIPSLFRSLVDDNKYYLMFEGINEAEALSRASTNSYWILLPCYIIILFFAVWGYKINQWKISGYFHIEALAR